jgi:hypothetical protein
MDLTTPARIRLFRVDHIEKGVLQDSHAPVYIIFPLPASNFAYIEAARGYRRR